ncbi:MAG TPA: HAMP domain-containing protein [Firmicutes bacterium]|nr:HAMP domain-containing protein [Bacillota bacterium]
MKVKEGKVRNIGFSLASKLNIQLWLRLMGMFLTLNALFLTASLTTLIIIGERQAVEAVLNLGAAETTAAEVELREGRALGFPIPGGFQHAFPKETAAAKRSFLLEAPADVSFYKLLDNLKYRLDLTADGKPYRIIIDLSTYIWLLKIIFLVLLAAQLFLTLKSVITRADLIKKALKPISELAAQAQSLSLGRGLLAPAEMEVLAGTLDEINAARLDTRIDLADTQDELKNLAVAINGLLDRINESYRLQARFVSDASHELRSPIAAIQGYANLLDRWGKNDPAALQESIDAIIEETNNMKELVEQLLFLARGDSHTVAWQTERFDLGALAEILFRETQMVNGRHHFKLVNSPAYVMGDQGLIKQAGRVLIENAVKYTPAGGTITISVAAANGEVKLTVQDTGIGIPPKDLPHIFERFYRADESRARATGGTGLGLSIAKWIAERHGGSLEVLSREEFGSRISLVLPEAAD